MSLKTVSRVINGEPGVRPETIEKRARSVGRVCATSATISPPACATAVRSFTLGLVIEDVANPFYSAIAQAVEDSARERSSAADHRVGTGGSRLASASW